MIYAKTANRIHKTHIEREQNHTAFTVKRCLLWDILWLDIWHHKVTTHDQKSLNKIYQRSDERLRHNHVGHQYTNRNTQCFLLHYVKKNLLLKRNLLVSRTQMAANVGVWNLVSCKILAMVATFPVMPRHAITTEM